MKKYEYKTIDSRQNELNENELNNLGEFGWELICIDKRIFGKYSNYTYYFKRLKNEENSN